MYDVEGMRPPRTQSPRAMAEGRARRRGLRTLAAFVAVVAVLFAVTNPALWLGHWREPRHFIFGSSHAGPDPVNPTNPATHLVLWRGSDRRGNPKGKATPEPATTELKRRRTDRKKRPESAGQQLFLSLLGDRLPLRLTRLVLPAVLTGRQAVTAVFNRAVIPLGSNFGPDTAKGVRGVRVDGRDPLLWDCGTGNPSATPPVEGRARWVTTSILRFDPLQDWPTDLTCTVLVNPKLRAFDGSHLDPTATATSFTTPSLTMTLAHVASERAEQLTGGNWAAQVDGDAVPECPPDAALQVSFNTAVDPQLLKGKLVVVDGRKKRRPVSVVADGDCGAACPAVTVRLPPLEVGVRYEVLLPQGSRVSAAAGPTARDLTFPVGGLHHFTIPWARADWSTLAHRRQRLWIRHGLPETVDLGRLQRAIAISPAVGAWSLGRVSPSVLVLQADFQPNTTYRFSVEPDPEIVDGYGLPLRPNSVTKRTEPLAPFLAGPEAFVLQSAQPPALSFLGRQRDGLSKDLFRARPVSAANVGEALQALFTSGAAAKAFFAAADTLTVGPPTSNRVETLSLPGPDLLGPSGLFLGQYTTEDVANGRQSWGPSCGLYGDVSFGLSAIASGQSVTVWATDFAGQGVEGVAVQLWHFNYPHLARADEGRTNTYGVASFTVTKGTTVQVMASKGGKMAFTQINVGSAERSMVYSGDLITDRALYRAGEQVFLKGYVQVLGADGNQLPVVSFPRRYILTAYWGDRQEDFPVEVDPTFGGFALTVPIPTDVKYGPKSFSLQAADRRAGVASAGITIADPRLPSGTLDLRVEAPVYRPTDASLPLVLATDTYTGGPAKETAVTLRWAVGKASGEEVVDLPAGRRTYAFALPASVLERAAKAGEDLRLTAEWFTATRDLLTKEAVVPIARSPWRGYLTIPDGEDGRLVPGFLYEARLTLTITGKTSVTPSRPPAVAFRVARAPAEAEGKEAELFAAGTALDTPVRFTWEETSPKQTTLTAAVSLTLPALGHFWVGAKFTDDAGVPQYAGVAAGKTELEWRFRPLTTVRRMKAIEFQAKEYAVGSPVTLRWVSPFAAGRLLLQWHGPGMAQPSFLLQDVVEGDNVVEFPLEAACAAQCQVVGVVVTPSQPAVTVPVPVSQMLDTTLPQQVTLGPLLVPVPVPDRSLDLALTAPQTIEPGAQAELTFDVPLAGGEKAELAVWVVDKALLDLLPSPLPASLALQQSRQTSFNSPWVQSSYSQLASAHQLHRAYNLTKERLEGDPWATPGASWPLGPQQELDLDTEAYLRCQTGTLTALPNPWTVDPLCEGHRPMPLFARGGKMMMAKVSRAAAFTNAGLEMAMAPPMAMMAAAPMADDAGVGGARAGAGGAESGALAIPAGLLRTDFQATALFKGAVQADSNGKATVAFTAPDNVGTWVVRAMAVSVGADGVTRKYAARETEVVAKRPLSLLASLPRIVRVGDSFEAGCTVVSATTGQVTVEARFAGNASLQFVGPQQRAVNVTADVPREVVFRFLSVELGVTPLQFVAKQGDHMDAFAHELPGLGLQDRVFLASSFAITAVRDELPESRDEGLEFPAAVPHSGRVVVTAGVGRFPAVQALGLAVTEAVRRAEEALGWAWATDLLSLAMLPLINEGYAAARLQLDDLRRGAADALRSLAQYCSPSGLLDMPVAKVPQPWTSFHPSAYGVFVWHRLSKDVQARAGLAQAGHIQPWEAAVASELRDAWTTNSSYRWFMLAEVYFAYGHKQLPATLREVYPVEPLLAASALLDDQHRAMLVIVLCEAGLQDAHADWVGATLEALYVNLRTTGRTAYVSQGPGAMHALPMEANALALWAVVLSQRYPKDPLVEKLANYVGQGEPGWGHCGVSSRAAVYRMLALAQYDAQSGSANPDLRLLVQESHSGVLLLERYFGRGPLPLARVEAQWADLPTKESPGLRFSAVGQGEASVAVGLDFVPATLSADPIYFGIYVEKTMLLLDKRGGSVKFDAGKPLRAGQTVKVIIQVTTPDDLRGSVVVADPLPGCLEAVDPNVKPSAPQPIRPFGWRGVVGGAVQPWLWFPWDPERWAFPVREVRKEAVTFLAPSWLSAGSHTCSYEAVVVTSGDFQVPPTKVHLTTQPEVMGLSNTYPVSVAHA